MNIQTKALVDYTTRWIGFSITTQKYRHIIKAIDRKFLRGPYIEDGRDDDDEAVNEQMAAHDLMQGHSVRTGNIKYGVSSELLRGLTDLSISLMRNVCDLAQEFYDLMPRLPRPVITMEIIKSDKGTMTERCEYGLYKLFGKNGKWRSDTQKEAVEAIVKGVSHLIIVLPTVDGKSMCIWLPTLLDNDKTTLVIVPLIELVRDVIKGCKKVKVHAIEWVRDALNTATVVVTTVNSSNSAEFHKYAADLHLRNMLARIVYDEIHYPLICNAFRSEFDDLSKLMLPVQIIGLSAMIPPVMES